MDGFERRWSCWSTVKEACLSVPLLVRKSVTVITEAAVRGSDLRSATQLTPLLA